jgi:hypothetical protein
LDKLVVISKEELILGLSSFQEFGVKRATASL